MSGLLHGFIGVIGVEGITLLSNEVHFNETLFYTVVFKVHGDFLRSCSERFLFRCN